MSDTSGKTFGMNNAAKPVCRVAYTLNNAQPVVCTIIGDQPLFYMDFDYSYEDDEMLFDAADIGILENEIRDLEREIAAYDKFSLTSSASTEERVAEFFANSDHITKPFTRQELNEPKETLLDELKNNLSQSRMAKAYMDFAAEYKVEIKLSTQIEKAFYDRKAGLIMLNPNLDLCELTLLCARELRRHWQHRQGVLIHPLTFQPDQAVLVNRAQIADLTVSMIRIAWELQLSGNKDVWERIEKSPMADLGRAFAKEAFLDFRTINDGNASSAVFEAWFLSERCCQEDKKLIQQMLADYQGYVFDTEEATQGITPNLIAGLGSMPYGKNYLAAHAPVIMNDPIFTDVRDRSNANFLWFIKFERSFKETEQELQTSSDPTDHEALHDANPHLSQDRNYEAQQSAEIIDLHGNAGDKEVKRSSVPGPKRTASADIVYLRRIPGDPQF